MKTVNYFNNIEEANAYIDANKIDKNHVDDRNIERYTEYFNQFQKVDGCRVLIAGIKNYHWYELHFCIEWEGVHMMLLISYSEDDNAPHRFQLVEDFDNKGFDVREMYDNMAPNKIGVPTAKKLTDWTEWLTKQRQRAEAERDSMAARIPEHINECCRIFPEAANVEWKEGYWLFEKQMNGIKYTLEINSNGRIYEKTELDSSYFDMSATERAARLMQNGLQFITPSVKNS